MRVVLAGASGLIGSAVRASLGADGHDVVQLVRRPSDRGGEHTWNPAAGHIDPELLAGADAVVCLSGAGVADHRWTDAYKDTLRSSRLGPVSTLARAVAGAGTGVLITASAVGYYGDTGEAEVDESAPSGTGFLARLCADWEAAAAPAQEAGARVVQLRTGIVLTRRGGLVRRLLPIVRLGVAGRVGSGRQFIPWISLADEVGAIRFALEHPLEGPVNLTGPNPARNAEFVAELARLVHRPSLVPVPGSAIRLLLGKELAQEALGGQRAVPAKLLTAGFRHQHEDLTAALSAALTDQGAVSR